ncbi:MAG: alpha/beta hydrolase, partial [Povalibacter sp.]
MSVTTVTRALALAAMGFMHSIHAAEELPLYPGVIPNSIDAPDEESVRDPKEPFPFLMNISRPTLTVYLPSKANANRAAVIILPGGGYRGVSFVKEGRDVAKVFN